MIFFTFFLVVQSCFWTYEEVSLYPTNGEYLEYPMSTLILEKNEIDSIYFRETKLNYFYEPIIPNVQIINAFNEIAQIEGYEFVSISSNQTHFATLTIENLVILYEWKNFHISQYGSVIIVEERYQCYNIIFFDGIDVLLDCYAQQNFYLLKLINTTLNIVYSTQANKPVSSKMQGIYNESKSFLIYAQYYQNLSILTLFSYEFKNLTSYSNYFIQIVIPQRENPYLYILCRQSISQFIITQDYTFKQTSNESLDWTAYNLQVYYDYQAYSECDQLLLIYISEGEGKDYPADKISGCQNGLVRFHQLDFIDTKTLLQFINLFFNDEFILFQSQNYLTLFKQMYTEESMGVIVIHEKTQIYFNPYDNYLFIFNKQIIVYQLAYPSLQINITDQQVYGQTYDITIYAQLKNLAFTGVCKMFMSITILDQNDTNIYVMYDQNFPQYRIIDGLENKVQFIGAYSGKLLNYSMNTDNKQFGQFNQTTFQKRIEFQNQQFYLAQFLSTFYGDSREDQGDIYFIGVTNESISIYQQEYYSSTFQFYQKINITINAQSLQVACNIYRELIIGLSDNDTIYLYQNSGYYYEPYFSSLMFKFELQFQQFLVTFNNLITLYINQEIYIMTLNFTNLVIINETMINKLFNGDSQLKFSPIQIAVNTYSLSSCLFINNINNVIIVSIGQNNIPIPISIIQCKFQIKQINIVNQYLILSYICNQGLDLCFQVWSIQNYKNPFFMKNMMSVEYKNQMQILSDNLFFYVQFSNNTVYVYNPYLTQHMSLYYQLQLSAQLICTIKGYLFYENQINSLSPEQSYELKVNQSQNFERSYPQVIYNYTVTSLLNLTANQSTPNQSLTYRSNFTFYQPKTKKTINLSIRDLNFSNRTFTIPMNIILNRQTNLCYFPHNSDVDDAKQEYFSNNICQLRNFGYFTTNLIPNYTLVTAVNNQFFILQNNSALQILNQNLQFLYFYNYSNLYFTECLKSTSFNLNLSSICQNQTGQYWLCISLDSNGSVLSNASYFIPIKFTNVSKINNIAYLNFILGFSNHNSQQLYLFNSNSMQIQLISQSCQDFSLALLNSTLDLDQQKLLIIFFISNYMIFSKQLFFSQYSISNLSQERFYQYFSGPITTHAQILILEIIENYLFILVTSMEGFGQLYQFIFDQNWLSLSDILTTIPAYNDLMLVPNSIYSNGFLLQQFKQGNTYIIGIYKIYQFLYQNFQEPILMLGQLNSTSLEYALITNNEDQSAMCLALNNGTVLQYPIYTQTLECHYKLHRKTIEANISCKNDFSSGSYEITFILPELDTPSRKWIYSLIILIILQLIGFYILVKYRMSNIAYINTELAL